MFFFYFFISKYSFTIYYQFMIFELLWICDINRFNQLSYVLLPKLFLFNLTCMLSFLCESRNGFGMGYSHPIIVPEYSFTSHQGSNPCRVRLIFPIPPRVITVPINKRFMLRLHNNKKPITVGINRPKYQIVQILRMSSYTI